MVRVSPTQNVFFVKQFWVKREQFIKKVNSSGAFGASRLISVCLEGGFGKEGKQRQSRNI